MSGSLLQLSAANVALVSLLISGCANTAKLQSLSPSLQTNSQANSQTGSMANSPTNSLSPTADSELVASDLVAVLMQLRELSPFSTTVQLSPPKSAFGASVGTALEFGGYGIQQVDLDQGRHYVSYKSIRSDTDSGPLLEYQISIADISVSRTFKRIDGKLFPDSVVSLRGAKAQRVIVNDDIYRQRGGNTVFSNGVMFLDDDGNAIQGRQHEVRVTNRMARAGTDRINKERLLVLARSRIFSQDRISNKRSRANVRMTPVKQVLLRFANNTTLDLGVANKKAITEMRTFFNPATDRFSVTGCSHGKSLMWDGTESMSLQRAMRVREELLIAGVALQHMHEESCFNTTYGASLPKRAVILTLEREPA